MNRLERLLNLVAALLDSPRPLPRTEIQRRVPGYDDGPSGRRAFERDKDALRAMGIPLVLEPIDVDWPEHGEGYRIPPEQYRLPDPGLAPEELAALQLAASTVRLGAASDGTSGEAGMAIWKLGGATGEVAGGAPVADLPGNQHLPGLFAAVSERRSVRFGYRGEEREVDPYRLSYHGGRWYLIGRDHGRDGERRFRLDRMTSNPDSGPAGGFQPPAGPAGPPTPPWRMGDADAVETLVLVDADQAAWAESRTGSEAVRERRPDGSVVLALVVTSREGLRSFVLGFLDHAEVLGPPELRADITRWLEAMAEVEA